METKRPLGSSQSQPLVRIQNQINTVHNIPLYPTSCRKKNQLMHTYIIYIILLVFCSPNMFRPSKCHIQGVQLIHFHSQINKMCTRC